MKQLLYLGLFVLFVTVALLIARPTASCYAPPRTEDTVPPFVEPSIDQAPTDSQSEVFKDAGGWINQREHPLSSNFQENAYSRTDYGSFGPYVSDIGTVLSENFTGPPVIATLNGVSETPENVPITTPENIVDTGVMIRSETFLPYNTGFGTEFTSPQEQSVSSTSPTSGQTQTQ